MTIQLDLFDRKPTLTQERLKELLSYDPETGVFIRLTSISQVRAGDTLKVNSGHGYVTARLDGRLYLAHRLAFLYMEGSFPDGVVDHINNCPADNRWANLRTATIAQNVRNRSGPQSNNTSGYLGVWWNKKSSRWIAELWLDGCKKHLGTFADKAEAIAARRAAEREFFGEFAPRHTAAITEG